MGQAHGQESHAAAIPQAPQIGSSLFGEGLTSALCTLQNHRHYLARVTAGGGPAPLFPGPPIAATLAAWQSPSGKGPSGRLFCRNDEGLLPWFGGMSARHKNINGLGSP
jgi:hypothetical protein